MKRREKGNLKKKNMIEREKKVYFLIK